MKKEYIGAGVHVNIEAGWVTLIVERDNVGVLEKVILPPHVWAELKAYVEEAVAKEPVTHD